MYTEENARGRFPLRDILLKAIVVLIFIGLIIFIITKITTGDNNSNKKISSTYDKVFSENLKTMEYAAFSYFTEDKLPTEVGAVSEITLREMINTNLIEAFTDADGKSCNVDESYIRLTKNDKDYTLRVNLECNDKKDYSLMKVGTYDYCEHDICKRDNSKEEKKDESNDSVEPTKEVEITDTTTINNSGNNNTTANNSNTSNNNTSSNNNFNQVTTMYEYKKVTNPVLSGWSSWSSWILNNNRYSAVKCNANDANCLKEIQLYSRREKVGTAHGRDVYATVHYYSYRTRILISSGTTDTKWSTYNDTNLLNQGYTYTGNMR